MIEIIPSALDGERLDRVVSMVLGVSRAQAAELVGGGDVMLDGSVVTVGSRRVREGARIEIVAPPEGATAGPVADASVEVPVVFEDDDVIVVDKPAGLVVHPGAGNPDHTLVNGLLATYPELAVVGSPERPGIVHRLDKQTSGLMVVARSTLAYERMVAALAARDVDRRYLVLAWGVFGAPSGVVDAPIGRSAREPTRMAVSARGREARTRYEVLREFHEPAVVTLLECRLETGRTHQIRVHLAAIDHPVVGDDRYGGGRGTLVVPRMFLHATGLTFEHPRTHERLSFESPLPADLAHVLDGLH